jgi:hypothetical protein
VLVLHDKLPVLFALALLVAAHAGFVECALTPLPNLRDARHSLERGLNEVTVVSYGNVAALSESECGVDSLRIISWGL